MICGRGRIDHRYLEKETGLQLNMLFLKKKNLNSTFMSYLVSIEFFDSLTCATHIVPELKIAFCVWRFYFSSMDFFLRIEII